MKKYFVLASLAVALSPAVASAQTYSSSRYYGNSYATVLDVDPVYSNTRMETVCSDNEYRYEPNRYRGSSAPQYRGYTDRYGRYVPYSSNDYYSDRYGNYGYNGYRSPSEYARDAATRAVVDQVITNQGGTVGAIVGAVVGEAVRGNNYDRNYGYDGYQRRTANERRYCWVENRPAGAIMGYDVTYRYNGRIVSDRWSWAPRVGQNIRIDAYGRPVY